VLHPHGEHDSLSHVKTIGFLLDLLFSLACVLLLVLTPLVGAWLGSSLVTHFGGPREAALAGGLLLFPVLPIVWEVFAARAFNKKLTSKSWYGDPPKRRSSLLGRLSLRTVASNLAFIIALLAWQPKVVFTALAMNGDWFLVGREDETSQRIRTGLVVASSGLEWLHQLANPNPYKSEAVGEAIHDDVKPTQQSRPDERDDHRQSSDDSERTAQSRPDQRADHRQSSGDGGQIPQRRPDDHVAAKPGRESWKWKVGATTWPWPNNVNATVAAMGPSDEESIESVARHIAARESDPFERVKALHDWVVTRLSYDWDSYRGITAGGGRYAPQDEASVFRARKAVCAGYARLLVALGEVTGDPIVFVVGEGRDRDGSIQGSDGHAWNAAKIGEDWYIIDPTWNDPTTEDGADVYRTDYLFIPPEVAIFDHFPEDGRWQLLETRLSRAEFLRQPRTGPGLARQGLTLLAPDRPSVEVSHSVELRVGNPRGLHILATIAPGSAGNGTQCGVEHSPLVRIVCPVPSPGRWTAHLFVSEVGYGTFDAVASIQVTRR